MAYIVPLDTPTSCSSCPFSSCAFSHPCWSKDKPNRKGYRCEADSEKRILEVDFEDNTTKAEWCPLGTLDDYMNDLEDLQNRLVDDNNGDVPFEQYDQDRIALQAVLECFRKEIQYE